MSPKKQKGKIATGSLPSDSERMVGLVEFTAKTLKTAVPTPFGSEIVETATGKRLVRRVNFCLQHTDPTEHAEVHAIRAACRKKKALSLKGYTLYTTCEPCPMCMASALWSGVDRVVYGATIDDAAKFCSQIYIYSKDMVKKSDLVCEVTGPVEQAACVSLFTNSKMQAIFRKWRQIRKK